MNHIFTLKSFLFLQEKNWKNVRCFLPGSNSFRWIWLFVFPSIDNLPVEHIFLQCFLLLLLDFRISRDRSRSLAVVIACFDHGDRWCDNFHLPWSTDSAGLTALFFLLQISQYSSVGLMLHFSLGLFDVAVDLDTRLSRLREIQKSGISTETSEQSIDQSINQPLNHSLTQSINQTINHSIKQASNQAIDQKLVLPVPLVSAKACSSETPPPWRTFSLAVFFALWPVFPAVEWTHTSEYRWPASFDSRRSVCRFRPNCRWTRRTWSSTPCLRRRARPARHAESPPLPNLPLGFREWSARDVSAGQSSPAFQPAISVEHPLQWSRRKNSRFYPLFRMKSWTNPIQSTLWSMSVFSK